MKKKLNLALFALVCTGILATTTASVTWSMQTAGAGRVQTTPGTEREQLRSRLADYRMPSASTLAREITLEIVREKIRTVPLVTIETVAPDS